jgi:hypothetical protein
MKDWERSTDNKECRELTMIDDDLYWSFVYYKKTHLIKVKHMWLSKEGNSKHKNTPQIPIKHLNWLINGYESLSELFEKEGTVIEVEVKEEIK